MNRNILTGIASIPEEIYIRPGKLLAIIVSVVSGHELFESTADQANVGVVVVNATLDCEVTEVLDAVLITGAGQGIKI